jgi:hypothetical protein
MNYIPLIALCVSSVLSVAAIVISALSFRSSWRAQRHSQIVSFEQRRQEVRQILFEGQLMIGEINAEMNRGLINAETLPDPDIPILARETISRLDAITRQRREALKILEELPSSPSTQARLQLEEIGGTAIKINTRVQAVLKQVPDVNKTIEAAIEAVRQNTSK